MLLSTCILLCANKHGWMDGYFLHVSFYCPLWVNKFSLTCYYRPVLSFQSICFCPAIIENYRSVSPPSSHLRQLVMLLRLLMVVGKLIDERRETVSVHLSDWCAAPACWTQRQWQKLFRVPRRDAS